MPRRKKTTEERVKQGLLDLALGDISDAVLLLYLSDEEIVQRLPKLKLINVSDIKRPRGGGMEIKFFDRLKAIERLGTLESEGKNDSLSFYDALQRGAENLKLEGNDNDDI